MNKSLIFTQILKLTLFFCIILMFQGCLGLGIGSSKFSCPMPKTMNLKCMPPSEIYKLSEKKKLYSLQKTKKNKDTAILTQEKCSCSDIYKNNNEDIDIYNFDEQEITDNSLEDATCYCEKIKTKENRRNQLKNKNLKKTNKIKKFCNNQFKQDNVDFNPILNKPKILLVWFSYWIDNQGDLHSNEYVYMKVLNRFWSIGKRNFNQNKLLLTPLVSSIEEENYEENENKPNNKNNLFTIKKSKREH